MARSLVLVLDQAQREQIRFYVDHLSSEAESVYIKLASCVTFNQLVVALSGLVFSNKPGPYIDHEIVLKIFD